MGARSVGWTRPSPSTGSPSVKRATLSSSGSREAGNVASWGKERNQSMRSSTLAARKVGKRWSAASQSAAHARKRRSRRSARSSSGPVSTDCPLSIHVRPGTFIAREEGGVDGVDALEHARLQPAGVDGRLAELFDVEQQVGHLERREVAALDDGGAVGRLTLGDVGVVGPDPRPQRLAFLLLGHRATRTPASTSGRRQNRVISSRWAVVAGWSHASRATAHGSARPASRYMSGL